MQVSVEETSSLGRKMTVQVPAEKINQEVDQRLDSMKRRVKIDGFRPGKVPMREVKRRYGGQVLQEVMTDTMQSSYREAIQQEKLQPAGGPKIEPQQIEEGEDLKYVATFDIYPEVVV